MIKPDSIDTNTTGWRQHHSETRDWTPLGRYRNISDETPTRIEVSIPPLISDLAYEPVGPVARAHESAVIAVARLEAGFGQHLAPLAEFLLRSESLASSKIEDIDAGWRAFGNALAGGPTGDGARSQLAGVHALIALVKTANTGPLTLTALLNAHRLLMEPNPHADHPGALRTTQSWLGGRGSSPIDAHYVPPPPELLPRLVDDLLAFANRSDLPILAQAAIAHAQFLSIHPFADGNGRIGRALVSAILRRRGLNRRVTVPLAAVIHADDDDYYLQLACYRNGDADAFVAYFSRAVLHASEAAEHAAARLAALPQRWRDIARPRANSADEILIANLLDTPVFNADTAQQLTGASSATTYCALDRLTKAGILDDISAGETNRVWAARDVLAELDALPLISGADVAPVAAWRLDSVMLLSSCRFRL
jgi:Fic family protein